MQTTAPCRLQTPRLYGLLKIQVHKEGVPLRPIVSNIGASTYQLSKYLPGLLSQLTGKSVHHMKNTFQFVQIMESLRVQPEDLMVSFDVVSLFYQRSDCGFTWICARYMTRANWRNSCIGVRSTTYVSRKWARNMTYCKRRNSCIYFRPTSYLCRI
jgi:hypothetical protein